MLTKLLRSTLPLLTAATAVAQNADRPNIIFFLVDDMGWQDTSLPFWTEETPQNNRYRTPNMERLADQGMMFTRAYACPVSSPSRCSLLSGMNAARHGVTNWIESYNQNTNASGSNVTLPDWNYNGVQPAATATSTDRIHSTLITPLPQLLHDAGYLTIHCGKGNFGASSTSGANPSNFGFDVNIAGGYAGGPGTYLAQDNYGSAIQAIGGLEEYASQGIFLTEALTQEAIKNLDKALEGDRPFYLYMSHYAIHTPYDADTRFTGNYTGRYDEQFQATLSTSEVNRAALIEGMDKSLGDLMDWLDAHPAVADNTIILFMSDNGGQGVSPRQGRLNHDPNFPSRGGKGSGYDGGVHEPMIVSWPNVVEEGSKNDNRVMIEDFFPSILEMAGVSEYQTVQTVDGKSFVDVLRDPSIARDRVAIWHYPNRWGESQDKSEGYGAWSAIMKGDYHLLYFWENQERRLYNVRDDIGEEHNLAQEMPELALQLAQELTDSLKAYGAKRPTLATTGEYVPWPVDGVQIAAPGDPMNVNDLGIELSTQDGEKHLYLVQDARNSSADEGGPFYWTLGQENGYPAVQVTLDRLEGTDAQKQQFYFTQGSDEFHLCIYTADGKPVSYTEGLTRSGYSATDKVTASYLQYGAESQPTEFQTVMTSYSGYFGITIDGLYISNRGSSHGADCNMNWVVMPYDGSSYADRGCRFKFISPDAGPDDPNAGLPEVTTNPAEPVYYRIRNARFAAQGKINYAMFRSNSQKLGLTDNPDEATQFYFTGSAADGVLTAKIHNNANDLLMAGEASWNSEGCDWYIKPYVSDQGGTDATTGQVYSGYLICDNTEFKVNWYVGSSDTSIKLYDYKWDGNIFHIEKVVVGDPDEELAARILAARTSLRTNFNTAKTYTDFIQPDLLNCYSQAEGDEDYAALMAEVEAYLEASPGESQAVLDKLNDYNDRVKAVYSHLTINQPRAHSFLRIRSAKTLGYARSYDESLGGDDPECMSLSTEPDDYGIFYYDGQYLVNFLNGLYMDTNWLHVPGAVKSKMDFRKSADGTVGAYYIVALDGSKGERNLMVNNSNHSIMYRSNANNTYNNFLLEYVTEVPVTIGENGWGSTYLPQTATLPTGLVAYLVGVGDGKLELTSLGNLIPAATPVLLSGESGAYRLALGFEDIHAESQLKGTYTTEYTTGEELVWNGETMVKAADEVIWGFTAYMTADSGAEGLPSDIVIGIKDIRQAADASGIYDLSGRRVQPQQKGIYIQNQRKVVLK
ncbi:MAG: sulfatase-like hydrolase/transferase [Bacteroidaceae bacterium]|nr:sulfatase-like hydrolase/transferase [Bacteroidaceae bacterium]